MLLLLLLLCSLHNHRIPSSSFISLTILKDKPQPKHIFSTGTSTISMRAAGEAIRIGHFQNETSSFLPTIQR